MVPRGWSACRTACSSTSALRHPTLGRYSFLAADPFDFLCFPADGSEVLTPLGQRLGQWTAATLPGLPPFQGGAAGLLSYDLGRSLERVPPTANEEFDVPALAVGFYDVVVAFDHVAGRAWIISQGLPRWNPPAGAGVPPSDLPRPTARSMNRGLGGNCTATAEAAVQLPPQPTRSIENINSLAPQFPVAGVAGVTSNFTRPQSRRRAVCWHSCSASQCR